MSVKSFDQIISNFSSKKKKNQFILGEREREWDRKHTLLVRCWSSYVYFFVRKCQLPCMHALMKYAKLIVFGFFI